MTDTLLIPLMKSCLNVGPGTLGIKLSVQNCLTTSYAVPVVKQRKLNTGTDMTICALRVAREGVKIFLEN